METNLIHTAWVALAEGLRIPENSAQYVDLRRAFYAGAYTVMTVLKEMGTNEDNLDADADILEGMHRECEAFRLEVTYDPNQN